MFSDGLCKKKQHNLFHAMGFLSLSISTLLVTQQPFWTQNGSTVGYEELFDTAISWYPCASASALS